MSIELDSERVISKLLTFLRCSTNKVDHFPNVGLSIHEGELVGKRVVVVASNPSPKASAIGEGECFAIHDALERTSKEKIPLLFLWSTSGARISEGADALAAIASVLKRVLKPRNFMICSIVVGPTAGIGAYLTCISEFSFLLRGAQLFMTGPKLVKEITGLKETNETIGGYEIQHQSGIMTKILLNVEQIQSSLELLFRIVYKETEYESFTFQDYHGHAISLQLKQIAGRLCGVTTLNQSWGDPSSIEIAKLNKFLVVCDSLGIPIVTLINTRGMLPGSSQEKVGALMHGAELMKLMSSYANFRLAAMNGASIAAIHLALGSLGFTADYVLSTFEAEIEVMEKFARRAFGDFKSKSAEDLLRLGLVSEVVTSDRLWPRIEEIIAERGG